MLSSTGIELIMATVVIVIVILMTRRVLFRPENMSAFDIALIFAGLFFGMGPWIAFIYGGFEFYAGHKIYRPEPPDLLLKAYFVIILYILGVSIVQRTFCAWKNHKKNLLSSHRQFTITKVFEKYSEINWQSVVVIIGCIWFLRIFVVAKYGIWISGSASRERILSQPYYIVVLNLLAETMVLGCLAWASTAFWTKKRNITKYIAGSILLLEFLWMFTKGRSQIIIWMVILFLGFLAAKRKLSLKYIIVFCFLAAGAFQFIFPVFLRFRNMYHSYTLSKIQNPVEHISKAVVLTFKTYKQYGNKTLKENRRIRPLFLRAFICRVCEGLNEKPPMMGRALIRSVECVIPAAIFPGKKSNLPPEQLIQQYFDYPLNDTASTWPAIFCADFGIPGGVIAGLIVGLWIICMELCARFIIYRHPLVSLSIIAAMIACLVKVESNPALNWMLCRNIAVILIIAEGMYFVKLRLVRRMGS